MLKNAHLLEGMASSVPQILNKRTLWKNNLGFYFNENFIDVFLIEVKNNFKFFQKLKK